jgi:hypothetical protein
MNKQIISLIGLLMLSSGSNAMFQPDAGAGLETKAIALRRIGSSDDLNRVSREVAANLAEQAKYNRSNDNGAGAIASSSNIAHSAAASSARRPQPSRTQTAEDLFQSAESGDENEQDSSLGRRLTRLTGSDLAHAQLNMHQSLVNPHLLQTTRFNVGRRECTSRENEDLRYALEQLATVQRIHQSNRTTSNHADLQLLVETLRILPESQQAVIEAIRLNPSEYRNLYPAFIHAITHQLERDSSDLREHERVSLQHLKDRLFLLYGGQLLENNKYTVFEDNENEFRQCIQAQEPWVRRNWGKFATGVATGAATLGFFVRPYIESGARYTARVGIKVALDELIGKFWNGGNNSTPPTPPTE